MQRLDRQRVGTLRYSGPPRPVPLPERPPEGKLRTDSTYDWREIGEQVTGATAIVVGAEHPAPSLLNRKREDRRCWDDARLCQLEKNRQKCEGAFRS